MTKLCNVVIFAGENTDKDEKNKTATEEERRYDKFNSKADSGSVFILNLVPRRKFNALMKIAFVLGLFSALHGPQYCHLALKLLYGGRWSNAPGSAATLGSIITALPSFHLDLTAL